MSTTPAGPARFVNLRPMLAVTDLSGAVRFFVEKLGFYCSAMHGNPSVWAQVERDGVEVMMNAPPLEDVRRDVPRSSRDYQIYYFDVTGVAALHAEFAAKGVAVTPLRVAFYGMKEFEVRGPDASWLWFAQPTDEEPTECE